jgi:uncharacterized membrane protein
MLNFIISKIKILFEIVGIYLLWICIHYISGILYTYLCTPTTFIGFVISPFLAITPECKVLRWFIYNGGNIINDMWIVIGTWVSRYLLQNTNIRL